MSDVAHHAVESRTPALRPLAVPTEHGGWGFLFEPILLGLAVGTSGAGALVALAFVFAFLARQPLKLALQDALRRRVYPRTQWCRRFAVWYSIAAFVSLASAVALAGPRLLLPLLLVGPLGAIQIVFDARNRSRALAPELGGSIAMSSSAAAIALAAGAPLAPSLVLSGIVAARGVPTVVFVRTLLQRAHGKTVSAQPAIALHLLALGGVALFASKLAFFAMLILLVRASWLLTRDTIPQAKQIGWTEIVFGLLTVVLAAAGQLAGF